MTPPQTTAIIPIERIERVILMVRDQRVIVDADLARLYGVATKRLNEQVKRNPDRFPGDFMFQLSPAEKAEVVANCDHLQRLKFSPQLPLVFTEHGAIMAANVLNSPQAVKASVFVVRAFVKLRQFIASHRELGLRLSELEHKLQTHDRQILSLINAIRELMATPDPPAKPRIGYITEQRERQAGARVPRRNAKAGLPEPREGTRRRR